MAIRLTMLTKELPQVCCILNYRLDYDVTLYLMCYIIAYIMYQCSRTLIVGVVVVLKNQREQRTLKLKLILDQHV